MKDLTLKEFRSKIFNYTGLWFEEKNDDELIFEQGKKSLRISRHNNTVLVIFTSSGNHNVRICTNLNQVITRINETLNKKPAKQLSLFEKEAKHHDRNK